MKQFEYRDDMDKTLSEQLQEASLIYEYKNLADTSIGVDFVHGLIKKQKKKRQMKALKSVAVIAVVLITGLFANIWMQADGVYGGKRFVEKCINIISPLDISEEINEFGERTTIITVTEEKNLSAAKEQFEDLRIPTYVPEGFTFDILTIRKGNTHSSVEYVYKKDTELLVIAFEYNSTDSEIMIVGDLYKSPVTGQEMYVDEIKKSNEFSVIEITDSYDCIVLGTGSKDIGIKIIENIKEYN